MRRSIQILALSFLAFMVLATMGPGSILVPVTLLLGWVNALRRIGTALAASPDALIWAGVALALMVAGTQGLGSWLWRSWHATGEARDVASWRWRWTLMLHAGLAAVLFAAMSVTGVAHQTGWLIAAREPVYVPRERKSYGLAYMHQLAGAIDHLGREHDWHAPTLRKLWPDSFTDGGSSIREALHAVFLEDTNGRLMRVLVFPRQPQTLALTGVGIVEPETRLRTEPAGELTHLLRAQPPAAPIAGLSP